MMYEIVGIRSVNFTGRDGNKVEGVKLYLTFEDQHVNGLGTESVFVGSNVTVNKSYQLGDRCDLIYNRYGKVQSVIVE